MGEWFDRKGNEALKAGRRGRRAGEQNTEAVARWLEVEYPAIAKRAKKEKAVILWLDQTGLRSDASVGN